MIAVDGAPFADRIDLEVFRLVDEIATLPIAAVTLLSESMTSLGFVGSVMFHVDLELLGTVSELALSAIGTVSFFSEVLAERTLSFGGASPIDVPLLNLTILSKLILLSLSGSFRFGVETEHLYFLHFEQATLHICYNPINVYRYKIQCYLYNHPPSIRTII